MYLDKPTSLRSFSTSLRLPWRPQQAGLLRDIQDPEGRAGSRLCRLNFGLIEDVHFRR
jgi:hypothetical protein